MPSVKADLRPLDIEAGNEDNDPLSTVPADTVEGCRVYWSVMEGDTCSAILDKFELTIDQFYQMNPAVMGDCTKMQLGLSYCVVPPTPFT